MDAHFREDDRGIRQRFRPLPHGSEPGFSRRDNAGCRTGGSGVRLLWVIPGIPLRARGGITESSRRGHRPRHDGFRRPCVN
jgi:hypothetical protein